MALLTATVMMASNIGPAFAIGGNYTSNSEKYFNEIKVKPVKLQEGESAADFIKNPDQPAIYTLYTDFKVPTETSSYRNAYQPYEASVGEDISAGDKAKVNKNVKLPSLVGFNTPDYDENFSLDYNYIVSRAKEGSKSGNEADGFIYRARDDFRYDAEGKTIAVKDVFQDINDFDNYVPKSVGSANNKRHQSGNTGSTLQVTPLQANEIKGFVPESSYITVQLPDDVEGYEVEYRYNRAHYDVSFDTDGGSLVESRSLFYEQIIPTLDPSEIPTKNDYKFEGWKPSVALTVVTGKTYKPTDIINDLNVKLIMPDSDVKFTAVWTPNSGAKEATVAKKSQYTVNLDYNNGNTSSNKASTVNYGEIFNKPRDPRRNGYTFMGWQWVEKSKPGQVPVLYSFNNPVVSDITLKAIWVKNSRVDVQIYQYFLDSDGNLDTSKYSNPLNETLYEKRVGNYTATVGDQISDKWTLASISDLDKSSDPKIQAAYQKAKASTESFKNSYFQKIMVKENQTNEFYFFYKPFKTRDYKINYVDVDSKEQIANQEEVKSDSMDFDARNYRPIPGWKLEGSPQQQLFFDTDPDTKELVDINQTGKKEITFNYKDIRVIEVPDNTADLEGYVRVNFKADEGGSFGTDPQGNDIKELHYYVIKGLKSNFLPVPKELGEGEAKVDGKYYITPDKGKNFSKWYDSELLNINVIIEKDYIFKAKFDWSGLRAKPMVITEAYKDPDNKWTNDYAPKIADLKKQIVWMQDGNEEELPADASINFVDENGNELTDDDIYNQLKELGIPDKDATSRVVTLKAKVEFSDKKNTKEIDLPITVYKNRYEALTSADKPLFLSEAEKLEAKDGGLKDILSNTAEKRYIKVTVNPSNKPDSKDSKVYYVNPNAWVEIPEVVLTPEDKAKIKFLNWTADDLSKNDDGMANGVYDFAKRFKFTQDTIISPVSSKDVVEQKGEEKPEVPDSFVKVIVKTTDKATDATAFEKTFWVDPLNKVDINVNNPIGKIKEKVNISGLGQKDVDYTFKGWQKVKSGTSDDSLSTINPPTAININNAQFTDKVTVVEASYYEKFAATPIGKPIKIETLKTPKDKEITEETLKNLITPPGDKVIKSIRVISKPDGKTVGDEPAKIVITYTDGSTQGSDANPVLVPVEVHDNIVPSYDGEMPEGALNNYVKISFKAGTGGTISDKNKKAYYVSPEVEVDLTKIAGDITKTPDTGYINDSWDKDLKGKFSQETIFTFGFKKLPDIVEVTDDSVKKPKDYAEVIFQTDGNGTLDKGKEKITYYVNPKAGIKIVELGFGQRLSDKEIAVPKPKANKNYEFYKWYEELDTVNEITADKNYVANFNLIKVTLTYKANGATGKVPNAKTVKYGTREVLANQENLVKDHYTFLGWKLDTDKTGKIYKPGDDIVLEEDTVATAQWQIIQHTVNFDTKGGSDIASQKVDHGRKASKPDKTPTKPGYVFKGWKEKDKEKESDPDYDFNTEIIADKTLVAIWENAVQKIDENDTVGEQFIKVIFREGNRGKLTIKDTEQTKPVAYKVGKDLSFADAVKYGMLVPDIKPNEYYKAQQANEGWDKPLELNKTDITFIAAYEIESNVIPIKPGKTDKQIKDQTPDDMIVVDFKVDDNRAYLLGTDKFYVKRNQLVNIKAPLVVKTDITYNFKVWDLNTEDENNQVSFATDTTIREAKEEKPDIEIRTTSVGLNFVELRELTDGARGHLILIRGDQSYKFTNIEITKTIRQGRRRRQEVVKGFDLKLQGIALESGDRLQYYAKNGDLQSVIREIIVK